MRVALLNPFFWPEVRRGSERMVHDLATGLLATGHRPRLTTASSGPTGTSAEDGVTVVRNWRPPNRPFQLLGYHEPVSHVPLSYLSLLRADDDLAHAFYPTDAAAAIAWARRRGHPSVFSVMGIPDGPDIARRRSRRRLWEAVTARSTRVVALSEAAGARLRALFDVDPVVIHPGVDLQSFARAGPRSAIPTILCPAASDDPRKRVGFVTEAFARVRRTLPEARLLVSRSSDPRANRLIAGCEGVELRVLDRHEDLLRAYSEAWVTVLAARSEAFGLILVESLACGTPVSAARDGGIPEVVGGDGAGTLFEPDDLDALASALAQALGEAPSPDHERACRQRAARFSIDRCVAAHSELYADL